MRTAEVTRNTKETQIRVKLNLDGKGTARLTTGLPFFECKVEPSARVPFIFRSKARRQ